MGKTRARKAPKKTATKADDEDGLLRRCVARTDGQHTWIKVERHFVGDGIDEVRHDPRARVCHACSMVIVVAAWPAFALDRDRIHVRLLSHEPGPGPFDRPAANYRTLSCAPGAQPYLVDHGARGDERPLYSSAGGVITIRIPGGIDGELRIELEAYRRPGASLGVQVRGLDSSLDVEPKGDNTIIVRPRTR